MKPLVIRADAGAAMGTGHVMRCIALAQEWKQRGAGVTFVMKNDANLRERIEREGFGVTMIGGGLTGREDAQVTVERAERLGASWIVVDGYDFDASYQRALKGKEHFVLSLPRLSLGKRLPRLSLGKSLGELVLLGCRYALIRREFIDGRREREIPPVARRVLVTLGGGDSGETLRTVLRALDGLGAEKMNIDVVVGGGFRDPDALQKTISAMDTPARLHVNTTDMPELMAGADIAVSGGGSTNYELAFMGLPALSIVMADNQRPVVEELERRGIVRNLGWHADLTEDNIAASVGALLHDHKERARMSALGRQLIDGKGAQRVVDAMVHFPACR